MNRLAVSGSLLALACSACSETPVEDESGLHLRFAGLGTCTASGNEDGQFPSNADRVVIELTGGGLADPLRTQAASTTASAEGDIIFPEIPVGQGYTLRVAACSGSTPRWAGQTSGVDVAEFQKSFPSVFLTPIDALTCTGNATSSDARKQLSEPRAFAALAASGDAAYALGGGKKFTLSPGNLFLDGTQSVDRYDARTCELASFGTLSAVRVGAVARPLADGRIRVVGGATKLRVATAGKPGVWADPADFSASGSEVFDPTTKSSSVEYTTPLAPMAAIGQTSAGAFVAVGGTAAGGSGYTDQLVIIEGATGTSGTAPGGGRFGSTVVGLGGDLVLVWGGNVDGATANVGVLVDAGQAAANAASALTVTGADSVPYAATGAVVGATGSVYQVLIVGGGTILAGGNFGASVIASPRMQLVTVDTSAKSAVVDAITVPAALAGPLTRAYASMAVLPEGDFLVFGGYTAFTSVSQCQTPSDCLQRSIVRFAVNDPGGTADVVELDPNLALDGGPLGAAATRLTDGAWLFTTGVDSITSATIGKDPALVRLADPDADLCTIVPPASP